MIDEKKLIQEIGNLDDGCNLFRWREADKVKEGIICLINRQPQVGRWIPVSEKMPENEIEVEITFIRKHPRTEETLYLTARAFYTDGTMTTDDSAFIWNDCDNWEYSEEKDAYIIPEGWWESVSFAEEFSAVDCKVIAWRSLMESYKPKGS